MNKDFTFKFKNAVTVKNCTSNTDATVRKYLNYLLDEVNGNIDAFIETYGSSLSVHKNGAGFYTFANRA